MTELDEAKGIEEFIESLQSVEGLSSGDISELKAYLLEGKVPLEIAGAEGAEVQKPPEDQALGFHKLCQEGEQDHRDIRALITEMDLPQKIKLAMFGNSTCRGLLVLDSNRMVQEAALSNPRLQEGELESFCRNPNISAEVLRIISSKRRWMASYTLKLNLVCNPKTPGDLSLKWLRFLHKADLRRIARSKNLPQMVVVNARKRLVDVEKQS